MEFVCIRKCYTQQQLFTEGQTIIVAEDRIVPCPSCPPDTSKPCKYCKDTRRFFPPHHFVEREVKIREKAQQDEEEKQTIEDLKRELDKRGVPYDKRWGRSKLDERLALAIREGRTVKKEVKK